MHNNRVRRFLRPEQSEHFGAKPVHPDARTRQFRQNLHRQVARRRADERRDADHRVREGDDEVQRVQSHTL